MSNSAAIATPSPSRSQILWGFIRQYPTPFFVIVAGIVSGLVAAILLRSFLVPITNWLISVLQWLTAHLKDHLLPAGWGTGLADLQPIDPKAKGFDYGAGAFGAAFLFTKIKEIGDAVFSLLSNWRRASGTEFLGAFLALVVGFGAIGLSVYGIKALVDPKSGPTFVFDSLATPLSALDPDSGHLTFYVSFPEEAGRPTFENAGHGSVTVSPGDKAFLGHLRDALKLCAASGQAVHLRLEGFASGSLWSTVEPELQSRIARQLGTALPESCDEHFRDDAKAAPNALACVEKYKDAEVHDVPGPQYLSSEPVEAAKAFNVYLANRRREAAAKILGVAGGNTPAIVLDGAPWADYAQMENAIAVDDARAAGTFQVKGILTRSVAVTITDPANCSTRDSSQSSRTVLTLR